MEKIENKENKVDNRDKYLVIIDKITEDIETLKIKSFKLRLIALNEVHNAASSASAIRKTEAEIKRLDEDNTKKEYYKKNIIKTLKSIGIIFIPEVIIGYLILLALSGVAPSIIVTIIETILIDASFLGLIYMPGTIRYSGVNVTQNEEIITELKNRLSALKEEKQLHLDNAANYNREHEETDAKITKLEDDLEFIINARNQIIGMIFKSAIDNSLVDTASIDKEISERGIVMELK